MRLTVLIGVEGSGLTGHAKLPDPPAHTRPTPCVIAKAEVDTIVLDHTTGVVERCSRELAGGVAGTFLPPVQLGHHQSDRRATAQEHCDARDQWSADGEVDWEQDVVRRQTVVVAEADVISDAGGDVRIGQQARHVEAKPIVLLVVRVADTEPARRVPSSKPLVEIEPQLAAAVSLLDRERYVGHLALGQQARLRAVRVVLESIDRGKAGEESDLDLGARVALILDEEAGQGRRRRCQEAAVLDLPGLHRRLHPKCAVEAPEQLVLEAVPDRGLRG